MPLLHIVARTPLAPIGQRTIFKSPANFICQYCFQVVCHTFPLPCSCPPSQLFQNTTPSTPPLHISLLYSIGSFSCPCNPGFTGFQGGVGFHVIIISMVRGGEVIHTFGILIKGVLYMWQTLERDFWGPKFAINPCQADNTNRQHHHQRLFLLRFAATQSRIGCICFFFKCAFSRFFKCVLSRWAATTWTSVPTTQTPANTAAPTMRAVST